MVSEKLIEKKLTLQVKKMGGIAVKLVSPYHRGLPDRMILLPGGYTAFAELKSTGKTPTPLQRTAMTGLRDLGFFVEVIDSLESLSRFIDSLPQNR